MNDEMKDHWSKPKIHATIKGVPRRTTDVSDVLCGDEQERHNGRECQ